MTSQSGRHLIRARSTLTEGQKLLVVQRIAMFDTPKMIADALREECGVTISRQSIEEYDPAKRPALLPKWKALHDATRAAFLEATANHAVASRLVCAYLTAMATRADVDGNAVLTEALHEELARVRGADETMNR